ncbi:MAG: nucleotide exchange factor GrpE [Spirochaetota bacterium]
MASVEENELDEETACAEDQAENGTAAAADPAEKLLKEKEDIIRKKDEEIAALKEQILRGRADFDNFRKRCIKTEDLNKKLAVKDFAVDVIKINDDLIRASEVAAQIAEGQSLEQAHKLYVDGVMLISKNIERALHHNGISEIDSLGCPFNPCFHEAVEFDVSEDVDCDTVTTVHQKGFIIDQIVIRPARVKVTKSGKKNSGDNTSDQECSSSAE